jgi:hypothetical protein
MPATAAMDNETLDHLLSVVDDSSNLGGFRELSKAAPSRIIARRTSQSGTNLRRGSRRVPQYAAATLMLWALERPRVRVETIGLLDSGSTGCLALGF